MPLLRRPSAHCSAPNLQLLGYLFVLGALLAVVGCGRGWFTAAASSQTSGPLVADELDPVRAVPASHTVEGRITAVAATDRQITLAVAEHRVVHQVPSSVVITRGGGRLAFEHLHPDLLVRLTFDGAEPIPTLLGVEILP